MKEFKINPLLTIRLENNSTNIYVKGEHFIQCKYLLMNLVPDDLHSLDDIDSIDEAAEFLDHSLHYNNSIEYEIEPETEFWAHCSNLQVWYENGYDTRLIHKNLSFYLLSRLADVGDMKAYKILKEEIAIRFSSGFLPVQLYLINQYYLTRLLKEELQAIIDEPLIDKLIKTYPNDLLLMSELGVICGKIDLLEKGLTIMGKVEAQNPLDYRIWEAIGRFYFLHLKNIPEALRIFKQAFKLNPESAFIAYRIGEMYIDLKDYDNAKSFLEESTILDPNYSWSWTNLGVLFKRIGDLKKSKEMYEHTIEINPYQFAAYSNLGEVYYVEKKYEKAFTLFNKELKLRPDNYEALYYLGSIYLKRGELSLAESALEKALHSDEYWKKNFSLDEIKLWKKLSELYYRIGKFKEAYNMTHKVLEEKPNLRKYIILMEEIKKKVKKN